MNNKVKRNDETEIEVMIKVLLKRCDNTNFYSKTSGLSIKTIESTIGDYNKQLKTILKFPLHKDVITIKKVKLDNYKRFIDWYSKDGYIYSNNQPMVTFLTYCIDLVKFFHTEIEDNEYIQVNQFRLESYFINIKEIIEYIYKNS